ncbi:AI-2E family transporter [Fibrobacter sp.]|uniref:AI-2E family transporter n=1 Tax=Fibrobacter sp. TaxID=35828 RepID=UPI003870AE80
MRRIWTVDRVMRLLIMAAGVGILLWVLHYLSGVLAPFFAAFLIAYIFDPLVCKIQSKVKYRIVAVIAVLTLMVLVVGGAVWIFVPMVVGEIRHLGELIPKLFSDSTWVERLSTFVPKDLWQEVKSLISWDKIAVAMQTLDFWNAAQSVAGKVLPSAWSVLSKTSNLFVWFSGAVLIFMYLVFIMLDMPKLRGGIKKLFPTKYKEGASDFGKKMDMFMGSYFRAQSLVALTVGILYAIGFGIIGLPMGVAFGLVSGALNMVPYLQLATIPVALLLAVVYALDKGMPFWEVAAIVAAIYLVVQIIEDMFLVPKIVGSSMDLPPVGILLSLSIWGKLLGFLGLIVAIPFTCLCLVYLDKIQKKADSMVDAEVEPPPEA